MSLSSIRSFNAHKDGLKCSLQRDTCGEATDAPTWWQNINRPEDNSRILCFNDGGSYNTDILKNIMLEIHLTISQLLSHIISP